jgi:hypothetical protein
MKKRVLVINRWSDERMKRKEKERRSSSGQKTFEWINEKQLI